MLLSGDRSPNKIFLYKTNSKNSTNGFIHSSYGNKEITIINTTNYQKDIECTGIQKEIYQNQGTFFSGLLTHEFNHSMLESYPNLIEDWIDTCKWVKNPDDKWANYFLDEIVQEADANIYPWEDFAVSLAVTSVNPRYLSHLSPRRLEFFLNHPLFRNWQSLEEYKKPPNQKDWVA